jgi:hypothetical protein
MVLLRITISKAQNQNSISMSNLLYSLAVILIISWAIGFFVLKADVIIHALLVMGIIIIILKIVQGNKIIK